jgi:CRISPR-associated endoribonuclease Cas6
MLEDFIQNFVIGLFEHQTFDISSKKSVGRFRIEMVETLPSPEYKTTMKFKAISPIVVSTMREYKGKLHQYYFRPGDEGLGDSILINLVKKYVLINHRSVNLPFLQFNLDNGYLSKKGGHDKLTKLITIKEDDPLKSIQVKAFVVPFTLTGSIELIQTAYECGIGEKNSLGFGMIEVV